MQEPLSIYMGRKAADTIVEQGWRAAPFRTLIGASGGPKWLILSELDQVLAQLLGRSPATDVAGIFHWYLATRLPEHDKPGRSDQALTTSLPVSSL